jgi:hypothetical protein
VFELAAACRLVGVVGAVVSPAGGSGVRELFDAVHPASNSGRKQTAIRRSFFRGRIIRTAVLRTIFIGSTAFARADGREIASSSGQLKLARKIYPAES